MGLEDGFLKSKKKSKQEDPLEAKRAEIIKELEWRNKRPTQKDSVDRLPGLNNFFLLFLGTKGVPITQENLASELDQPMCKKQPRFGESELAKKTTWREFFRISDEVIKRLNNEKVINLEKIKKIIHKIYHPGKEKIGPKIYKELENEIMPVYMELRLMGFSHFDLWQ